ncbi:alkene reductase [Cupriavidus plantarum]|uniref:N-ethylmaleimide reductase n=1 Tax=Cupriavidus plantarum TaxID=942865 RepID=A0A316EQU2_9BURK|nr:alkene reductase [Cupriavidus plantarum]NYI00435.1 N-ethylmaleimide reductase [Cupriavidus plantarum]PWK34844.1 N-ethylmaleimide reductase [Cupriavidus plantarum]RLK38717.1 N-ethylmaleimide reductase [Cupriavidus plantarum]CAG2137645.1 N-ethylmaleimide reductase [Cupriavidus plantarum]SMR84951.1 N-ethylmaleimide reductase [Cupriavidus plantarum]
MPTNEPALFSATTIGAIEVANRIAMAPLTRSRADMNGVHSDLAVEYYRQRASAGLIISEATNISRQGRGYAFTPGIYTEAHVAAWRRVTDAVHEAGGKIVCQLWHVGRMSHASLQENGQPPVAPSAIQAGELVFLETSTQDRPSMPRALETSEIPKLVDDYRHAARCAKEAGFDGVEVHSANCYLLEQFLRDSTNKRTDQYGGSIENRTRFPVEAISAVAEVWGPDRVGVRLSPITRAVGDTPLDSDPQALYGYYAERLGKLGMAYLHCIEGQTRGDNAASAFDFKALHASFGGKYIANNSYSREMAIEAVDSGHADMVAFGRPFIANPDLVDRLRRDAPLASPDPSKFYGGGAAGYTDYETLEG